MNGAVAAEADILLPSPGKMPTKNVFLKLESGALRRRGGF